MASRLADLVRRARRLSAERDRLIDAVATEWARALRGQRLTPADLDELWAALTEDALRQRAPEEGKWTAQAWRQEAREVIARVREKVEASLRER
jgi:hypothetical protein